MVQRRPAPPEDEPDPLEQAPPDPADDDVPDEEQERPTIEPDDAIPDDHPGPTPM